MSGVGPNIPRRPGGSLQRLGSQTPVATRVAILAAVGCAILGILVLRLWALTVLNGAEYVQRAEQNVIRQIPVEAPRGAMLDRNGTPLVTNRAAREVVLNIQDVAPARRPALYAELSRTLGVPESRIKAKVESGLADPLTPTVIAKDVTDDWKIFYLEEHSDRFPGVDVRNRYVRNYVFSTAAAHILGQVGEVSPEQLKTDFTNLKPGEHVGQSGLERTYDEYLRGTDGYRAVEVDAAGVRQGDGRGVPATPGRNLRLSIDLGLQRATERALAEGVALARRTADGRGADAGAAVAMDPRTGEILAMASFPTYDPNMFVTPNNDARITATLKDRRTPLSNRAISGLYPPGSTFKVITGLAAMEQGFATPETQISCPSSMEIAGTKFRNWTPEHLGSLDMAGALEVSCDTYFYSLALDFYNTPGSRLQDASAKWGLGSRSGVDLPGEQAGVIPTPAWRRETFEGGERAWSPGHSVNLSIGQGDLLTTPLQMTRIYAGIANDGVLREPRLARSIEDPSGKEMLAIAQGPQAEIHVEPEHMRAIRNGLFRAANGGNGTSTAVFDGFAVPVSGKTGTAEKPPHGDMAWYCGYAPAAAPTIAACAIIEKGGHGGSAAAPVVLRMFQKWFRVDGGNVAAIQESD